jgi:transposase
MPAINYWTNHRGKRLATRNINGMLLKFVGRKLNPIDDLFAAMRKVVVKYFKANPDDLKYFSNGEPFDYNFEVEELGGYVTNVEFQV